MSSSPTNPREQQFCLRWNNYQSNLIQVFNQLFQTESFVDVTLACEGHSVKAHRIVLAACSPYFLTVLSETPCSHPVVILQGVKWTELKAIVEFMYKGEINISQDQLASLLRVAESLKIRGLADVGGEEAEAVLTSPTASPRVPSQFWAEDTPRKRRRLSEEPRSRSRSRSPPSGPHTPHTPVANAAIESLESVPDLPGPPQSRASNPPPSLPSPSPVASLASSLSSLAHLHGPMPPPGPPIPHHLAHLPPLSPLSPLLNMHPMSRHHSPEDFEIRPGIAEMIREEERVSANSPRFPSSVPSLGPRPGMALTGIPIDPGTRF
ncbi:UNVERIFIED_CONTAM: hypothetical protein GTU68_005024 [Idotea baltica]|nr:hypothetical protein [Idotea baltica]